jgi:hypothetical protein
MPVRAVAEDHVRSAFYRSTSTAKRTGRVLPTPRKLRSNARSKKLLGEPQLESGQRQSEKAVSAILRRRCRQTFHVAVVALQEY